MFPMPFHPEELGDGVFTDGTKDICLEPILFVVFAVGLVGSGVEVRAEGGQIGGGLVNE